jgi:hypothetical protein
VTGNPSKYEGGTVDTPTLTVRNLTRDDVGDYSCAVENDVGRRESENASTLSVFCK